MIGSEIYSLSTKLWRMNRSITGEGVRETLSYIKNFYLPNLKIEDVPSGKKVFDWEVPPE